MREEKAGQAEQALVRAAAGLLKQQAERREAHVQNQVRGAAPGLSSGQ